MTQFTIYYFDTNTEATFPDKASALKAAQDYVGNNRPTKPFPNEETYLYGPGDGTCTLMIRRTLDEDER
jgi:hypothetical protein